MPAARRLLLRSFPMVVAVLALVLPAAPALAQPIVSITVNRINGQNVSFDAWENVEVTEGSSIRFSITSDPAPTTQAEEIGIGGNYESHLGATAGISDTVRRISIAHFNNFTLNLATQDFSVHDNLYENNDTYEGNRTVIMRINKRASPPPGCSGSRCKLYKVDDADSNSREIIITVTDEEDAYDPDVNASGSVDASDALILYYAYSLRNDLGTGR